MLTPLPQERWTPRLANHLYSRAGFFGTPEERRALYELGRDEGVAAAVAFFTDTTEDWSAFPLPTWIDDAQQHEDRNRGQGVVEVTHWYYQHLANAQPLAAKILKFNLDHMPVDFATFQGKGAHRYMFHYVRTLRERSGGALGGDVQRDSYHELVRDVSRAPAMMKMLDLDRSRRGAVNENFARELLELFTLGVDGGYTEQDVAAAADAFTGYRLRGSFPFAYYHDQNRADTGPHTLLGVTLEGEGQGDAAIDVIFLRIQTAYHLVWKLWRYFVAPTADESVLQELAINFHQSDYQVRPLLRELFASEVFYEDGHIGSLVKDPADWIVSACKAVDTPLPLRYTVKNMTQDMGYHPLYPPDISGWPEPDGAGNQWLSAGTTFNRLNIPAYFTHNLTSMFSSSGEITRWDEDEAFPNIDLDTIAPRSLRTPQNVSLLARTLQERFSPLHPLRRPQVRILTNHFRRAAEARGTDEATRELIRLTLALPEFNLS